MREQVPPRDAGALSHAGWLADIVPARVSTAEAFADLEPSHPFPAEAELVVGATDRRRREFLTARRCAHEALAGLGRTPGPVGRDGDRVPVWPPGVVGSITHCDGYRAAAVAEDRDIGAIGIDAEPNRALKPAVARLALRPAEVRHLVPLERDEPGLAWSALVFCAKEAVYKAWYPTERRPLGFHDVEVNFEPVGRSFLARVLVADHTPLRLSGRYACEDGLLVAAVVVKASLLKR